jgi:hypothetical protein
LGFIDVEHYLRGLRSFKLLLNVCGLVRRRTCGTITSSRLKMADAMRSPQATQKSKRMKIPNEKRPRNSAAIANG